MEKVIKRFYPCTKDVDRAFSMAKGLDKMRPLAVILDLVVGAPHSDHMRLDLLHLLCRRYPAEGGPCGYVKVSFNCAHTSHLASPIGLELLAKKILTIWRS